jgi:hypothetical protein
MTCVRSASLAFLTALAVAVNACSPMATPARASWQAPTERQVVMFGVYATPGSTVMDPKIPAVVAAQLRKTMPGYGFKLLQAKSQRVTTGQSLLLNLGDGFGTSAMLLNPLDPNGKVQMKFELTYMNTQQFQSVVVTPADQFNFFDKMLPNNSHLLIGVGAR